MPNQCRSPDISISFMHRPFSLAILGIALFAGWIPAPGRADDATRELPKDGAWSRYEVNWERLDNNRKRSSKVTLSCVGHTVEKDEPCRWVEFKHVVSEGNEKGTYFDKLLIRDKDLIENENPLKNVVRAWHKVDDGPPELTLLPSRGLEIASGPLFMWTPGALKDAGSPDQPEDIEYQKGRLKASQPRTGHLLLPVVGKNGDVEVTWSRKYTAWQHADLSIGFAKAKVNDELLGRDGKVRRVQLTAYHLDDAGTGAKSELPDNN